MEKVFVIIEKVQTEDGVIYRPFIEQFWLTEESVIKAWKFYSEGEPEFPLTWRVLEKAEPIS